MNKNKDQELLQASAYRNWGYTKKSVALGSNKDLPMSRRYPDI